jgi:hypothetical protein
MAEQQTTSIEAPFISGKFNLDKFSKELYGKLEKENITYREAANITGVKAETIFRICQTKWAHIDSMIALAAYVGKPFESYIEIPKPKSKPKTKKK